MRTRALFPLSFYGFLYFSAVLMLDGETDVCEAALIAAFYTVDQAVSPCAIESLPFFLCRRRYSLA